MNKNIITLIAVITFMFISITENHAKPDTLLLMYGNPIPITRNYGANDEALMHSKTTVLLGGYGAGYIFGSYPIYAPFRGVEGATGFIVRGSTSNSFEVGFETGVTTPKLILYPTTLCIPVYLDFSTKKHIKTSFKNIDNAVKFNFGAEVFIPTIMKFNSLTIPIHFTTSYLVTISTKYFGHTFRPFISTIFSPAYYSYEPKEINKEYSTSGYSQYLTFGTGFDYTIRVTTKGQIPWFYFTNGIRTDITIISASDSKLIQDYYNVNIRFESSIAVLLKKAGK